MRVGLLSDIHGNADALISVLDSASKKKVQILLCCGDYVGYYYEPNKVMSLLDKWLWHGVSGNHEAMLLKWTNHIDREKIIQKYGSGISKAIEQLSFESVKNLYQLPPINKLTIDNKKVILCHGSPWDRDFYVYPDSDQSIIDKMFNFDDDFDVLVFGHTHYPVIWKKDKRKVINPGSVGQTRDRIPGASWALWNTETNNIQFFKEQYDHIRVTRMCKRYDPKIKYLYEVLSRS